MIRDVETWDAVRSRRNVRQYSGRSIGEADLEQIVEAGRRAPSAHNAQPWDFVVVTDPEMLQKLSNVWKGATHLVGAAGAIAVVSPTHEGDLREQMLVRYDAGQATMAMMITAADLGIGTAHTQIDDQELARELLGHPEDRYVSSLFALGYPADRPLRPLTRFDRRPLDEVFHRERWSPAP